MTVISLLLQNCGNPVLYCLPVRWMLRCAWKTEERNTPMPRYHFRVSYTITHTGALVVDAAGPQVARRRAEQQLDVTWAARSRRGAHAP